MNGMSGAPAETTRGFLVHHFMDGNKAGTNAAVPASDSWGNSSDNIGGPDFGIADNSTWTSAATIGAKQFKTPN